MPALLWAALAFLSGALPFSVWVGRWGLGLDIRQYGDGNPGASNVFRAGGRVWGVVAILLDFFKGALPVGVAHFGFGVQGAALAAVALAPILGHAFSPFLGFRGGKALAVTFGIWSGLSIWVVPIILGGLFALWLLALRREGLAVLAGQLSLGIAFIFLAPESAWWAVWAGSSLILAWTHRVWVRSR